MTLGSKFKQILEAQEKERLRKETAEHAKAVRLAQENYYKVANFLEKTMSKITDAANNGVLIDEIEIPEFKGLSDEFLFDEDQNISNAYSPYYAEWLNFYNWANGEELEVAVEYRHDGYGIKSWYVITIKPI